MSTCQFLKEAGAPFGFEEWHQAIPDYQIKDGVTLLYSQGLRSIDNLELVW